MAITWDDQKPAAPAAKSIQWDDQKPAPTAPTGDTGVLSYLKNTFNKTAANMNVEGALSKVGDADTALGHGDISGAWDSIKQLIPNPKALAVDTYNKIKAGDYSGATANLVPLVFMADGASGGKLSGAAADAAQTVGGAAVDAAKAVGSKVADTASAVASNPVVKAFGPVAAKVAINHIPGVGPMLRTGMDVADAMNKLKATPDAPAPAPTAAPPPVTANVRTPSTVSLESSAGKGVRTADTLDADTQAALAKASQDGTASALPAQDKVDLVKAIKTGDNDGVNVILNKYKSVADHNQDALNKTAIISRYVQDHNIDLDQIADTADRQSLADAAVAHGTKLGLPNLPRSGKYRGISDSSMQAVRDALPK